MPSVVAGKDLAMAHRFRFMIARAVRAAAILFLVFVAPFAQASERPLVVGMALEPPHLDPTAGAAAAIDEITYANVFEGLTRIDRDGAVAPALASDWTVSDGGLTYTFTLRENVRFHDGSPFDASVAKFALDRARAPEAENAQPQLFDAIEAVDAVNPTTLVIRLSRPDGALPFNLAWGDAVMVHPDSVGGNKQSPIGTGPFQFERWRRGDRVLLRRHDDYWGKPAALARASFAFVPDPTVALAAVLAGDVHAFPNFPAPEMLPVLKEDPRFTVALGTTEGETIVAINARREPFGDIRIRRAIASAIDRKALIDGAMFGTATPIGSHYPPHGPAYVDLTHVNDHAPKRAEALLAEAGVTEMSVDLALPPPAYARRSGEIIAAQLRAVGIKVDLRPVEWAEWLSRIFRDHDYDLTIVAHTEPADISIYARPDYYFTTDDKALLAALAALERESDPAARIELLETAQRRIAADATNAFLFQLPKLGVWDARLSGLWQNAPIQATDLTDVVWRE